MRHTCCGDPVVGAPRIDTVHTSTVATVAVAATTVAVSGASTHTLQAIMDPRAGQEHHIAFDQLAWVEEQVNAEHGLKKVSTYLAQANLSLKSAHDSVRAAFIGI